MRAIFEPYQIRIEMIEGSSDPQKDGVPRAFDCNLEAPTYLQIRGDERNLDQSKRLDPKVPAFLVPDLFQIQSVTLPLESYQPGLRQHVARNYELTAEANVNAKQSELKAAQETLRKLEKASNPIGAEQRETAAKNEESQSSQTQDKPQSKEGAKESIDAHLQRW